MLTRKKLIASMITALAIIVAVLAYNEKSLVGSKKSMLTSTGVELKEALLDNNFEKADQIIQPTILTTWKKVNSVDPSEKIKRPSGWSDYAAPKRVSTPTEYLNIAAQKIQFKPGDHLIDIGSGFGAPAVIFATLNPGLQVTGYELVPEKVSGSQQLATKLGLSDVSFIEQDLGESGFTIPSADYYYLFNPAYPAIVHALALQIAEHSKKKPIRVIIYGTTEEPADWTHSTFRKVGFKPVTDKSFYDKTYIYIYEYFEK